MSRSVIAALGLLVAFGLWLPVLAYDNQPVVQKMQQMPLAFTKNMGQWDEKVLYRGNAGGATMWFTKEGATYQFARSISARGGDPSGRPDSQAYILGDSPSRPYALKDVLRTDVFPLTKGGSRGL